MVRAISTCWSHVTPKNVAVTVAVTSGAVSLVGFGLGFWSSNNSFTVISAISAVFAAFLAGTSLKYMPTGSLERVVNRLSALPQQFTALLKGDQGQPLGLDQLLEKIQSADFSTDQDIQNLKEILIRAKTTLDQQSQEVAAMKETNTQYKNLIDSFLPLLNQLGQEDATYKQTAERVSSLLGHSKITDLESGQFTQLKSDIQQARLLLIERGQKQAQLQKDLEKNMPNLTAKIEENKQLLEQIQQARSALTQQEIALKADSATA